MLRQTPRAYAALHGFASSPRSKKNLALAEAFEARSLVLHRPDLNQPSFGTLSFAAMLAELDRLDASQRGPRWSMVGSSLGGYVAALWAAAHPERVERLVLLCPAFELGQRWSTLATPAELEQWRETGSQPFDDATGKSIPLHYAFVREAMGIEPMPSPRCPTLVIHGRADTRVPIESSRRFVAAEPARRTLVEVDDGHELLKDLAGLTSLVLSFFEVSGERRSGHERQG